MNNNSWNALIMENNKKSILCNKELPRVKSLNGVSKEEEKGIVDLFCMLVSKPQWSAEIVDIELIKKEGLPAFEKMLGKEDFMKIQKYFGIGVKKDTKIKDKGISKLVSKLRTIENAQYYLSGYKECIEGFAKKLNGAPREMPVIVRAKIVLIYQVIFCGYTFFYNEYTDWNQKKVRIEQVRKNDNTKFYPEQLKVIYNEIIGHFKDHVLVYECIMHELQMLNDYTRKEVLKFAELRRTENGVLCSVNICSTYKNYSEVRGLKKAIYENNGCFLMESLCNSHVMRKHSFLALYFIYKLLKTTPLEGFAKAECEVFALECGKFVKKTRTCYCVCGDVDQSEIIMVSGQDEVNRVMFMFEELCRHDYEIEIFEAEDVKGKTIIVRGSSGLWKSAIDLLYYCGYLNAETDPNADIDMANRLLDADKNGVIKLYKEGKISEEEVKKMLGINEAFAENVLGYVSLKTPEEAIEEFARRQNYLEEAQNIDMELVQNVILKYDEEAVQRLCSGKIKDKQFARAIGITPEVVEFAKMFFDRSKLDVSAIEIKLERVKKEKKTNLQKYKLLIDLYCYVVENAIKCGPSRITYRERPELKLSMLRKYLK